MMMLYVLYLVLCPSHLCIFTVLICSSRPVGRSISPPPLAPPTPFSSSHLSHSFSRFLPRFHSLLPSSFSCSFYVFSFFSLIPHFLALFSAFIPLLISSSFLSFPLPNFPSSPSSSSSNIFSSFFSSSLCFIASFGSFVPVHLPLLCCSLLFSSCTVQSLCVLISPSSHSFRSSLPPVLDCLYLALFPSLLPFVFLFIPSFPSFSSLTLLLSSVYFFFIYLSFSSFHFSLFFYYPSSLCSSLMLYSSHPFFSLLHFLPPCIHHFLIFPSFPSSFRCRVVASSLFSPVFVLVLSGAEQT